MMHKYASFVGGQRVYGGREVVLRSPVDGTPIAVVDMGDRDLVGRAVDSAEDAFKNTWSRTPIQERQRLLMRLADIVQERSSEYALIECLNTGKTLRQTSFMDIPLGIEHVRYFGSTRDFNPRREIVHPEYPGTRGIVEYAPLGVVAAIAPWNVPFLMAVWKVAPALLAGNTVVLKPSHYTPLSALELAEDAKRAGVPDGVLNVVVGDPSIVGDALLGNPKVNHVSFTGSTKTGLEVLRKASTTLKKFTLELGGKSPNIVFDDADLERAAKGVLFGVYLNSGQLCEAGSRLLVQSGIKRALLARISAYMDKMRPGNPLDMDTDVGAITTAEQRNKIDSMVDSALASGAKKLHVRDISGSVPPGGYYYPPTLLEVAADMDIAREEVFGPVLSVLEFQDDDEAVELANATDYGLAAGVWSGDTDRALRVAQRIEAGTIWINEYHLLSAAAPRGGFKKSGVGRELGLEGVLELTQTRHIFINQGSSDLSDVAYGLVVAHQS